MWGVSKALRATGWVSNGTTQLEASILASIRAYAISFVCILFTFTLRLVVSANHFPGKSSLSTAGSFVRPSRPSDPPRSFLEGLHEKYASEFEQTQAQQSSSIKNAIEISGKVVEEVGFDKIRKQLAELQELRIVLLDGLRISGVLSSYDQPKDQMLEAAPQIAATCPKIIELDLSRSLLTRWRDVWNICNQLTSLKRLRLE